MKSFNFRQRLLALILLLVFVIPALSCPQPASAQMDAIGGPTTVIGKVLNFIKDKAKTLWTKVASVTLKKVVSTALNKIAFDSATYLGSGAKGQKPPFLTKEIGSYAADMGNAAAGEFIDALGRQWNVNLCEPNLDIKASIGLGLTRFQDPSLIKPRCTFMEMTKAWGNEFQKWEDMGKADYLNKLAGMFDPTGNELNIALLAMQNVAGEATIKKDSVILDTMLNEGWTVAKDIGGAISVPPLLDKIKLEATKGMMSSELGKFTGQALVDAANVFINQLAITAFDNALKSIGKQSADDANLNNDLGVQSDPMQRRSLTQVTNELTKILKPNFNTRGDYDILAELSICIDAKNPSPTDCVIDDGLSQAVSEHKTVGEAMTDGTLHKDWSFRRDVDYNQGYSLRSLIILAKYRIVPVSWQAALLAAEENSVVPTLGDLISCFSPIDKYTEFSPNFASIDQSWCVGLVDPNWVLKAPLNYCRKEGIGGQVLDKSFSPASVVDNGNGNITTYPGQLIMTRNDGYCADEQSCIKERPDGTCEAYGYCTEEKRNWSFSTTNQSCEPINNTCNAFTDSSGVRAAYLENTVDYSTCNSDNSGCKAYASDANSVAIAGKVNWSNSSINYFNKQAEACDAANEGCSELLSIRLNSGHNFLLNGDFEQALSVGNWNVATTSPGHESQIALRGGVTKTVNVGPAGYSAAGQIYTLSFYAKDCTNNQTFYLGDSAQTQSMSSSTDWKYYYGSYMFSDDNRTNQLVFNIGNCTVDQIKLEMGGTFSAFSDYSQTAKIYQKMIPTYLQAACYENVGTDYRLKANAPGFCNNYARLCNVTEVGCDNYSGNNLNLAAKTAAADYCRSECVGYDTYIQKANYLNTAKAYNFIPETAVKCSAAAVGCSAFTNLDSLGKGGEAVEYYTELKACVKPGEATCDTFYSWEGYSLKSEVLQVNASDKNPAVTETDTLLCNQTIFNLAPADPSYNPDCRQYYNRDGQISYHLATKTITCSDSCLPYRLDTLNQVANITDSNNCNLNTISRLSEFVNLNEKQFSWATVSGNTGCYVCKGSGRWDANQNSCVYYTIPGEGQICAASEVGCRQYSGNNGNNVRIVKSFDFTLGISGFAGICRDNVATSSESSKRNGTSLQYNYNVNSNCPSDITLSKTNESLLRKIVNRVIAPVLALTNPRVDNHSVAVKVGNNVSQGKSYNIKFIAKAGAPTAVKFYLSNGTAVALFGVAENQARAVNILGDNKWHVYQANLSDLNHDVSAEEVLGISANSGFYIDSLVLTEISEQYYLIENSWQTPNACYYDVFNNYKGMNYNLGCATYADRSNTTNYLRNFNDICRSDAAGCQLMVDTQNSDSPQAETYGNISVAEDKMVYAIYDPSKACNGTNAGCRRFGEVTTANAFNTENTYTDVYLKADPEKYNMILCDQSQVNCGEYTKDDGTKSYFKNPQNNICEFRLPKNAGDGAQKKWYQLAIKRCDINGNAVIDTTETALCNSNSDCNNATCILDTNDYLCPVSGRKTIGAGAAVYQPNGMVGTCDINASGCGEYIDPVSAFSSNLVSDPSFAISSVNIARWAFRQDSIGTFGAGNSVQKITIKPNRLHIFEVTGGTTDTKLKCPGFVSILQPDNTLVDNSSTILTIPVGGGHITFNSLAGGICTIGNGAAGKTILVREAIVGYQLESSLDKASCNGVPNQDGGCIMFNERKISGSSGYSPLKYNAYGTSYQTQTLETCSGDTCDTNVLLKVTPDRTCGRWLSCFAKQTDSNGEQLCYQLSECDKLDGQGDNVSCGNFVSPPENATVLSAANSGNATGYSVFGKDYLANMREMGNNVPLGNFNFEDEIDPGFRVGEEVGAISIINEPTDVNQTNVAYPAQGKAFARISGNNGYAISSRAFNLKPGEYAINFLVNINDAAGGADVAIIRNNSNTGLAAVNIATAKGWTRVTKAFTIKNPEMVSVWLRVVSGSAYFDDINIEPVLKVGVDEYVSKSCRLYPSQDAVSCFSDNPSVTPNGIHGYCLQTDPENNDSCLMWLPIDAIRSANVATAATTGFNGYNNITGVNKDNPYPYFCALAGAPLDDGNNQNKLTVWGSNKTYDRTAVDAKDAFTCLAYVRGYYPWSNRLANPPTGATIPYFPSWTILNGIVNKRAPYNTYSNLKLPFGMSKTIGTDFESRALGTVGAGLPYSCVGQVWTEPPAPFTGPYTAMYDGCTQLEAKDSTISSFESKWWPILWWNTDNPLWRPIEDSFGYEVSETHSVRLANFTKVFKNIFLKAEVVLSDGYEKLGFDNSAFGPSLAIPTCSPIGRLPNEYCAIYPVIENFKVIDAYGNQIRLNTADAKYTISRSGIYTLKFTTKIDAEQVPVSSLIIDWGDNKGRVELANIDAKENAGNPFSFSYYLTPGTYRIKVKVVDNWGFYQCAGMPSGCGRCCTNNILSSNDLGCTSECY